MTSGSSLRKRSMTAAESASNLMRTWISPVPQEVLDLLASLAGGEGVMSEKKSASGCRTGILSNW